MHFEFIRGGQTPSRKTANLSTPARERLVPMRDLASLFGCTEEELARWAECLAMVPEALQWRGVDLPSLRLSNAFKLHLAMRSMADDSAEQADLRTLELQRALKVRDRELGQSRAELLRLESRVDQRDAELKALMADVGGLERNVAQRADIHRDLANVQKLYVEAQAQKSELLLKLTQSQQTHRDLNAALKQTQARFDDMRVRLESARETVREAEAAIERIEQNADQATQVQAEQLALAKQRAQDAEAAMLALQPEPEELKHRALGRRKTAGKLRALRATCATATAVERNLERYCNRLEERLGDGA